jgi:hypothetical protein
MEMMSSPRLWRLVHAYPAVDAVRKSGLIVQLFYSYSLARSLAVHTLVDRATSKFKEIY